MNSVKRFAFIFRSPATPGSAAAATRKSPVLRGLMLAASAMAGSISGTAVAAEPTAVEDFVAKVMVVQTGSRSSSGQVNSTGSRIAYASAQDQFVDQVLEGRLPEGAPTSTVANAPADGPAAWPDVGFLRSVSAR